VSRAAAFLLAVCVAAGCRGKEVTENKVEVGTAYGRPVGVQIARDGTLLVADDVGDTVWRVSPAG